MTTTAAGNRGHRREYPYDGKTLFGIATQGLISVGGAALMSTVFMQYLTDYAGIGPWGATLATAVLFFGRIFDAINDPIQGWIMDSAKVTRKGKYKKFIIASVIICTVALILLYNIPSGIVSNPWLVGIWVVLFYFAYDVGTSFNAFIPLVSSITDDDNLRSRFFSVSRVIGTLGALPMGMVMSVALVIGQSIGSIKTAIGIAVALVVMVMGGLSLLGICLTREGAHSQTEHANPRVRFRDIVAMVRGNKAMMIQFFGCLFFGFTWTTTAAVASYYIKWGYNADLMTGQVDNVGLAFQTLVISMASFIPIFGVTPFAPLFVRKLGSNVKAMMVSCAILVIPGLLIFVLQLAGVLQMSFWILFALLLVMNIATGLNFVPGYGMWAECVDYNRYSTGKEMGGLVNALRNLLEKGQNAIAGAVVGVMLSLIGYNVDSSTGNYTGDLSQMPALLDKLAFLMGVVPAILGILAILVFRHYPITAELKAKMQAKFEEDVAREAAESETKAAEA